MALEWKGPSPQARGIYLRLHAPNIHHRYEPPCISEVLHQLLVCHLFQELSLFHSFYGTAGYKCGDEVHELASYEREMEQIDGMILEDTGNGQQKAVSSLFPIVI